jgi:predicted nucleic acid-binding protein
MHRHRVFIDSSLWIALRGENQTHHDLARTLLTRFFREREQFVSTPFVFAEIHATFSRSRLVRDQVIADFWQNRLMHLVETTQADHESAIGLLRQHGDKTYPFCDAVSFVVMRRLGVKRVAAFDDHFRPFGELEVIG